ncbi:hypothetical protein OSSY52_20520 [Tepiditoga spiralis]|uniref:RloB domain-containing protein n=1 Tax=Tepiditoga spiralis TaxID=2108365 RepID=A0A7G1G648_9BACT|nr:RloB family protein [Tepiditoga spiralis]BBE31911.1 hypothetical protein OSSY52_20520 [Tepiditoga spiralis]
MSSRKRKKRIRKENIRNENIVRYLIACEGKETEVNYFEGIKKKFEEKGLLRRDSTVFDLKKYNFEIKGVERGTDELLKEVNRYINRNSNIYDNIWLVFDKDNFSDESFNYTIEQSKNNGYSVAWSNKCFELWFLLYFEYNDSNLNCKNYIEKLDTNVKKNINEKGYKKNRKDMFEILERYSGWKKAYKNAEKLVNKFKNEKSYAKKAPYTTVYYLVKELCEIIEKQDKK